MEHSLSIILPVYNAQATLQDRLIALLDVLPDLTSRFEILVVDDGSTDQTEEIAYDLRHLYPQLRVARHGWQRGTTAAVQTGMARSVGDIVFVQEADAPISAADMRRLWAMRMDEKLLMARAQSQTPVADGLMDRLGAWGLALRKMAQEGADAGGIQMIRRKAVEELREHPGLEEDLSIMHLPHTQIARTDSGHRSGQVRTAPTFLKHLRDLALGE